MIACIPNYIQPENTSPQIGDPDVIYVERLSDYIFPYFYMHRYVNCYCYFEFSSLVLGYFILLYSDLYPVHVNYQLLMASIRLTQYQKFCLFYRLSDVILTNYGFVSGGGVNVAAYYALSLLLIKFPHALAFIYMYKHFQNGDLTFLNFRVKVYSPV